MVWPDDVTDDIMNHSKGGRGRAAPIQTFPG